MSGLMITLHIVQYGLAVKGIRQQTENITPCTTNVIEISQQAETMKQYRERLVRLGETLTQLTSLLIRDYESLHNVQERFVEQDDMLSRLGLGGRP